MSLSSESAAESLPFEHPSKPVDTASEDAIRRVRIELAEDNSLEYEEAAQTWLDAQCEMISGTSLGLVVDASNQLDSVQTLACWPRDSIDVPISMIHAAEQAISEQTVVFVASEDIDADIEPATRIVATPLDLSESSGLIAVFELPNSIRHQQKAIVQILHWGSVWFGLLKHSSPTVAPKNRVSVILDLLASSLEHDQLDAAINTITTQLATQLKCSRVSLGLLQDQTISVRAMSGSAAIDTRLNLARDIGAAMNEAVDQDATLVCPTPSEALPHVTFAQEVLARSVGGHSVMSTPLYDGQNAVGAITLERREYFDQECIDVCESLAVLLGPIIALKCDKEKPLINKLWDSCRSWVSRLLGPKEFGLKLYGVLLVAALVFLSFAKTDYRITTQARLEGSVKRVITAPQNGFIARADYRAGDTVEAGDVLAALDDRELKLQQLQLGSQREQLNKEHRAALTDHDRSTTAIVSAQLKQIDAQLDLIAAQLSRSQLVAPFAGIVLSGDLSQSIGSPVENGKVLFEIAPLEDYRVVLEVDERDIGDVSNAQQGTLTLTGMPNKALEFSVNRIVPVSTAKQGRNVFEVHAQLSEPVDAIRPGMEGIGKINVDRRKLVWVWTHELLDWLRLSLWTWIS